MDIDRELIQERYERAATKPIEWRTVPIEAAVNGCPFKLLVCAIIRNPVSNNKELSAIICRHILRIWPTPDRLARADQSDMIALMDGLTITTRRARNLSKLGSVFLTDKWNTVYDLPGFNNLAEVYMEKYAK